MSVGLRSWLAGSAAAFTIAATCFAASPVTPGSGFETRMLLLDAHSTGHRWVAVGERGLILLSDDGQHWRLAQTTGETLLTALTGQGAQLWAVGHDATILKSVDAGASWRRVHYAPESERPLLDVAYLDNARGFAVGAYGYFLETRDAGEHWTTRSITAEDRHYNAIAKLANGTLLIAGEAGTLLRSTDAGFTWQALPSPYAGSWFGILPLGKNGAVIFGLRGKLYRTDDAGAHWAAIPTGTAAALMGGRVLADGTVVVVGHDGVVLTSSDQAHTFTLHPQSGHAALSTLLANKHQWWLFGERGVTRATPPR